MPSRFRNRAHAGRALARELMTTVTPPLDRERTIVLALPRGGVPVAAEVARELKSPLDVFVVRKLGAPGQPELAMGAVASGGLTVANDRVVREASVAEKVFDEVRDRELIELRRRESAYRGGRPGLDPAGCDVVLVDDGLATGATMRVGLRALRQREPARLIAAVPVGARTSCAEVAKDADQLVCVSMPDHFGAVGAHYDDFDPTSDDEVIRLLDGT